jgi:hypothetical protein
MLESNAKVTRLGVLRIWVSIAAGYVLFLFGIAWVHSVSPSSLPDVIRPALYFTLPPYLVLAFATVVLVLNWRLKIGPSHALAIGAVEAFLVMLVLNAWSAPSIEALPARLAQVSIWLTVALAGLISLFVAGTGGLLARRR